MSYVAIKGGSEAIGRSKDLFKDMLDGEFLLENNNTSHLLFGIDRIMGEGALYSEKLAVKAIHVSGCNLLEAAFYLRAHRSTCRRVGKSLPIKSGEIRVVRRISSAFKEIEGGQILGPSSDFILKLLAGHRSDVLEPVDEGKRIQHPLPSGLSELRSRGLIMTVPTKEDEQKPFDITRSSPLPPYPRSSMMQVMARGETGSMLGFAYTSLRGYGDIHPTIGDLRLGMATVKMIHPLTGKPVVVGEIRVTAVESAGSFQRDTKDNKLRLTSGFGFCFGFNETKAISMSILDLAMSYPHYSVGGNAIATDPEIIFHHIDGIESMGFTDHFKMPHYVTFQADLKTLERAMEHDDNG